MLTLKDGFVYAPVTKTGDCTCTSLAHPCFCTAQPDTSAFKGPLPSYPSAQHKPESALPHAVSDNPPDGKRELLVRVHDKWILVLPSKHRHTLDTLLTSSYANVVVDTWGLLNGIEWL